MTTAIVWGDSQETVALLKGIETPLIQSETYHSPN